MGLIPEPQDYVIFDGKSLADFGVYVSGGGTYSAAERDYEEIEVPGRSGALLIDNKRFRNIVVPYSAWIANDLETNLFDLESYLLSKTGYCRIEDTYHKDYYRLGMYCGGLDSPQIAMLEVAIFELQFTCKPQKFLRIGEDWIDVTGTIEIVNPTRFESTPLIEVTPGSTIQIDTISETGKHIINVTECPYDNLLIDSDLMDCYKKANNVLNNCNMYVEFQQGNFPKLYPGTNRITVTNGSARIQPRWWTI